MRILELIILQATENGREDFESLMDELAREISRESHEVQMSLYRNASLSADLCIALKSRSGAPAGKASHVGVRLAASLKALGLVDHTCWVEWITPGCPEQRS